MVGHWSDLLVLIHVATNRAYRMTDKAFGIEARKDIPLRVSEGEATMAASRMHLIFKTGEAGDTSEQWGWRRWTRMPT